MTGDVSKDDMRRLAKYEMLKRYKRIQRVPIFTLILCLFTAFAGGHRFYLRQNIMGLVLVSMSALVILGIILTPHYPAFSVFGGLFIVLYVMYIFELIRHVPLTDKANAKIKAQLEQEYLGPYL